jgi:hypothetical protein
LRSPATQAAAGRSLASAAVRLAPLWSIVVALAVLAVVDPPVAAAPRPPLPDYDVDQIVAVDSYPISFDGRRATVSAYRNDAYRCGRDGTFPFVVVEPTGAAGEQRPLWVLLHGGGTGYYERDGRYVAIGGTDSANDDESTGQLLALLYDFVGADGRTDTFIADRLAAGDRFVFGSLCDHDLYLGVGQPYPHDPNHDDTVDGLLANLAMVDAVTAGTNAVARRPTSTLWILGASAGAIGGYALAHNLRARDVDVDGLVIDSGLLVARATDVPAMDWVSDPGVIAKDGPYLADRDLWIDAAVADGFDVPLFATVEQDDAFCRGSTPATGCRWLHAGLAEAITRHGDPDVQQVHVYPGNTHIATTRAGTQVQDDLRAWYDAVSRCSGRGPEPLLARLGSQPAICVTDSGRTALVR